MPEPGGTDTRAVTLKLPGGQTKKFLAPKDATGDQIKDLIRTKHPELLGQKAAPPPPASPYSDEDQKMLQGHGGAMARFGQGFGAGLNPFHSGPEGMPQTFPGLAGKVESVGEDMLNTREMGERKRAGNTAGGVGMMFGTLASLAGPELVKAG